MKTIFKGTVTKVIVVEGKEMIERVPASAILAIDKYGDVIMVEQDRGFFGKILEIPAGKVEQGEDPMDTAIREFQEETGYKANTCNFLISYYPSVGYTTEQINCYYTNDITNMGLQRLDDGERIKIKNIKFDELVKMIHNGEVKDSKTIMAVFAYLQGGYT